MWKFIKELALYSVVVLTAIIVLMFFCYNNGAVLPEKIGVSLEPDETYHLQSHDNLATAEAAELIRGTRVYQLQEKDIFLLPITDDTYRQAVGFFVDSYDTWHQIAAEYGLSEAVIAEGDSYLQAERPPVITFYLTEQTDAMDNQRYRYSMLNIHERFPGLWADVVCGQDATYLRQNQGYENFSHALRSQVKQVFLNPIRALISNTDGLDSMQAVPYGGTIFQFLEEETRQDEYALKAKIEETCLFYRLAGSYWQGYTKRQSEEWLSATIYAKDGFNAASLIAAVTERAEFVERTLSANFGPDRLLYSRLLRHDS